MSITGKAALSNGINHIALLTGDVDAFTAFYFDVFDAEVLFDMDETDFGMQP